MWLSVLGVIVVFTAAVWLVDAVQTVESYYETYQKLKETEVMSRGWVSRLIPTSSYDIRETRRLDGAIVAVRFRFQPGDPQDVASGCAVLPHDDPTIRQYQCHPTAKAVIVRLEPSGQGQILSMK